MTLLLVAPLRLSLRAERKVSTSTQGSMKACILLACEGLKLLPSKACEAKTVQAASHKGAISRCLHNDSPSSLHSPPHQRCAPRPGAHAYSSSSFLRNAWLDEDESLSGEGMCRDIVTKLLAEACSFSLSSSAKKASMFCREGSSISCKGCLTSVLLFSRRGAER